MGGPAVVSAPRVACGRRGTLVPASVALLALAGCAKPVHVPAINAAPPDVTLSVRMPPDTFLSIPPLQPGRMPQELRLRTFDTLLVSARVSDSQGTRQVRIETTMVRRCWNWASDGPGRIDTLSYATERTVPLAADGTAPDMIVLMDTVHAGRIAGCPAGDDFEWISGFVQTSGEDAHGTQAGGPPVAFLFKPLTIAVLNGGGGGGPVTPQAFADVIGHADLVIVSETPADIHQIRNLAGMPFLATAYDQNGSLSSSSIVSRLPLEGSTSVPIVVTEARPLCSQQYRAWVVTNIKWFGRTVRILGSHFHSPRGSSSFLLDWQCPTDRTPEKVIGANLGANLIDAWGGPILVGGDFNSQMNEPGLLPIQTRLTSAYVAAPRPVDANGNPVEQCNQTERKDHLFVRGFFVRSYRASCVTVSDHPYLVIKLDG